LGEWGGHSLLRSTTHKLGGNNLSSTLADSTPIILFSEMLKFSKIISSKSKNIVKDNSGTFKKNISFVEMKISKLINCLTNMC
jgi:hypothetical protein